MDIALWLVACVGLCWLCMEGVPRLPARVSVGALVAIPLLLTPVWIAAASLPLFSVVKVYSVCVAAIYIQALRLQPWPLRSWVARLGYLLLVINILEAVVTGAAAGHLVTAAAGLLLVVSQAGPGAITASGPHPRHVEYRLGGWWIAAYTVWNYSFVYSTLPNSAAFALVHLLAPLLWSWRRPELWIQARTLALALMMILRVTYPFPPVFHESPAWYDVSVAAALDVASIAMACVAACFAVVRARSRA